MKTIESQRATMIAKHLKGRGLKDRAVLEAMAQVPREAFLPAGMQDMAYRDVPLPIGKGQTISQPYIVALMTELLEPGKSDRVLEVGTGSGYAAAVLSRIVHTVYTVERHPSLARGAQSIFDRLGYANIRVRQGDGSFGWPEEAPFDAIVVAAGAPAVPDALKAQLDVGGRLVVPVGPRHVQQLLRIRHTEAGLFRREETIGVRFVPLVGAEGWQTRNAG